MDGHYARGLVEAGSTLMLNDKSLQNYIWRPAQTWAASSSALVRLCGVTKRRRRSARIYTRLRHPMMTSRACLTLNSIGDECICIWSPESWIPRSRRRAAWRPGQCPHLGSRTSFALSTSSVLDLAEYLYRRRRRATSTTRLHTPTMSNPFVQSADQAKGEPVDSGAFKKEFQTVGRPPVVDNINDAYIREGAPDVGFFPGSLSFMTPAVLRLPPSLEVSLSKESVAYLAPRITVVRRHPPTLARRRARTRLSSPNWV
jgi:hypothetical protein